MQVLDRSAAGSSETLPTAGGAHDGTFRRYRDLGPLEVWEDGTSLEIGGRTSRAVLALLLINAGRPVPVSKIIDALWEQQVPPAARQTVYYLVHCLRGVLQSAHTEVLHTRAGGYVLDVETAEVDSRSFLDLLVEARAAVAAQRWEVADLRYRQAERLWRGEAFEDLADHSFVVAGAASLSETRVQARIECIEANLRLGRNHELLPELEELCRAHPLRERLAELRALVLYLCGRLPEALDELHSLQRRYWTELGIGPSPRVTLLQRAILRSVDPVTVLSVHGTSPGVTAPDSGGGSGPGPAGQRTRWPVEGIPTGGPIIPVEARLRRLEPVELDVLRLVALGYSDQGTAEHLGLTDSTVEALVEIVLAKVGLRDRVQAVVAAYQAGLVLADRRQVS